MTVVLRCARPLVLVTLLAACSFEADAAATIEVNSCTLDADCGGDARCEGGMCVARDVPEPLSVMLQVAPVRMPDGSEALPMTLERFLLEGELARGWALPSPVTVSGRIHRSGTSVEAEVRFTPASAVRGVTTVPVVVSTLETSVGDGTDYTVRLLDGVEYRMEVLPLAPELPPVSLLVTAQAEGRADADFDALALEARTFRVRGGPAGESLLVRAFDRETGEALSSSAPVVDGEATLLFAPEPGPFRVEVTVEQEYAEAVALRASSATDCDASAPSYPTFVIDDDAIRTGSDGAGVIELPALPERIRYEGIVALCPAASPGSAPESLPIDLRSTDVRLEGDTAVRADFVATTSAAVDLGEARFCVEVFQGAYEVVITPPSGLACALFAETRIIEAPDGVAATGALLELPSSAYLSGSLQTGDGTPIGGATIEVQALGRDEGIELAEDDLSVTRYNRSKQTTSDEAGDFRVPVDVGSYDVLVKPPAGSGYPWRVLYDVAIGAREIDFASVIEVGSPVRIEGDLAYTDESSAATATLEGAEVKAFAVVEDPFDTERAVPIGKTVADGDGKFTLLLSASTRSGW